MTATEISAFTNEAASHSLDETVAAIASAPGPADRGILRVSGQNVVEVLQQAGVTSPEAWHARRAWRYAVTVPVAEAQLSLPGWLMLWPTGRSFTGEPLAELHLPGSPPLLNEVLSNLFRAGARPAQPGEFTLRAFLAGRIDLVQAEAVLGVIEAGDASELQAALGQLAGGLSSRLGETREALLLHLADLEAGLDFVEEDIEFVQRPELIRRLDAGKALLEGLRVQSLERMQSTGRAQVVLAGLPNAGKSTLLNKLAGREAALVSPIPGTTRDYLSLPLAAHGVSWDLIDTAGWEAPRDGIEAAAGALRQDQFTRANLVVWCTAADLNDADRIENEQRLQECRRFGKPVLEVITKLDRTGVGADVAPAATEPLRVSADADWGLPELLAAIAARLSTDAGGSEMIAATAARCAESLEQALISLDRARTLTFTRAGDELIAMELREVLEHLGRITGRIYTDDILDRIFSRFCIGK